MNYRTKFEANEQREGLREVWAKACERYPGANMTRAILSLAFILTATVGAPEPRPHRPAPDSPPPQLMVNIKALLDASREFGVDPMLTFSVAWAESEMKEWAQSRREVVVNGKKVWKVIARGLMQISVEYQDALVRKYLGWHPSHFNWRNPIHSARLGCAYLRYLIDRSGTWGGVCSYNCGPGRFDELVKYGRRLPAETEGYYKKVLG